MHVQRMTIPELEKPENARWLALLIDTEGAIGWKRKRERHIIRGRTYIYVYVVPYISVSMKEIESKRTVDTAAYLIGVSPATYETKAGEKIRTFTVDYGRAMATIHYMKPYLDKFKRMTILIQTLFKYHTFIPYERFKHAITMLFGKYLIAKQANQILLQMIEEEFKAFIRKVERITLEYLL